MTLINFTRDMLNRDVNLSGWNREPEINTDRVDGYEEDYEDDYEEVFEDDEDEDEDEDSGIIPPTPTFAYPTGPSTVAPISIKLQPLPPSKGAMQKLKEEEKKIKISPYKLESPLAFGLGFEKNVDKIDSIIDTNSIKVYYKLFSDMIGKFNISKWGRNNGKIALEFSYATDNGYRLRNIILDTTFYTMIPFLPPSSSSSVNYFVYFHKNFLVLKSFERTSSNYQGITITTFNDDQEGCNYYNILLYKDVIIDFSVNKINNDVFRRMSRHNTIEMNIKKREFVVRETFDTELFNISETVEIVNNSGCEVFKSLFRNCFHIPPDPQILSPSILFSLFNKFLSREYNYDISWNDLEKFLHIYYNFSNTYLDNV